MSTTTLSNDLLDELDSYQHVTVNRRKTKSRRTKRLVGSAAVAVAATAVPTEPLLAGLVGISAVGPVTVNATIYAGTSSGVLNVPLHPTHGGNLVFNLRAHIAGFTSGTASVVLGGGARINGVDGSGYAQPLAHLDVISGGNGLATGVNLAADRSDPGGITLNGVQDGQPFLIGFQTDANDTLAHFGWLRVQVNTTALVGTAVTATLDVLGGAYHATPGVGVQAGVVPEPGTWLASLVIVGGIAVFRRRRAESEAEANSAAV